MLCRVHRLSLCANLIVNCFLLVLFAQASLSDEPRRHALLVGCTNYKNLEESFQLRGPANDVRLVRQLLVERFECDPKRDEIVTLTASEDEQHQPTRANIEREFQRLGTSVKKGEMVLILMGGHGSQQPTRLDDASADNEPGGLDEIFLPSDVGKWNGRLGTVENSIVDDEIDLWLAPMVRRGASVWLIADFCHSGSSVRGNASRLVSVINDADEAEWTICVFDNELQLLPASGVSKLELAGLRDSLPPIPQVPGWSKAIITQVERVVRAQNLLRLTHLSGGNNPATQLGFETNVFNWKETKPIESKSSGLTLYDGQSVRVQLKNSGRNPIDVTLLYVDSGYRITCLYPDPLRGELNRLGVGDEQSIPFKVKARRRDSRAWLR